MVEQKVLVLGEILLRHTPVGNTLWENGAKTQVFYGGSEANIAVTLASLEVNTSIASALPDNEIGNTVKQYFKQQQVNVDHVLVKGNRVGQYFATRGIGIRAGDVTYDRANSSFTELVNSDFDLPKLFSGVTHFHVSGITIALGKLQQELTLHLLKYAKEQNITISIDLNYRGKLWDFQTAKKILAEFLPYADICFGIEPIAAEADEITIFDSLYATNKDIEERMKKIKNNFNLKQIFHTSRQVDAQNNNKFKAYCLDEKNVFIESDTQSTFIIERVGSGDAFVSGVLYGMLEKMSSVDSLNLGVYLSTLKCTIYGDHLKTNKAVINDFLQGEHQGIKR